MKTISSILLFIIVWIGLAFANPPGTYQPLLLNNPANLTYLTSSVSATSLITSTFTSVNVGPQSNSRYIIVGVQGYKGSGNWSAGPITSVTIGGNTATCATNIVNQYIVVSICYILDTSSNTTENIVVTFAAAGVAGISVWNGNNLASSLPTDTENGTNTGTTSNAVSLTINGGGIGFIFGVGGSNVTTTSITNATLDNATTYLLLATMGTGHSTTSGLVSYTQNFSASSTANAIIGMAFR